jgi:uncharacterized protein (TIGR04222 family)
MDALFALSDGWFLAAWWLLAVLGICVGVTCALWLRVPNRGPTQAQGDPATGYDLAVLVAELGGTGLAGPALVAVASLLHREILAIGDGGRLRRGSRRLAPEASPLEAWLYERANGAEILPLLEAADEHARPGLHARLRSRGLHLLPQVDRTLRFIHGCVLLLLLGVGGLRLVWSEGLLDDGFAIGLGLSMVLVAWIASLPIRRPPLLTRRAWASHAKIVAAHSLPESLAGWPTPDVPASQVEHAVGLWGLRLLVRGGLPQLGAAIAGKPRPSGLDRPSTDEPRPSALHVDEALVRQQLAPTPQARLDRVAAGMPWVVLAVSLSTVALAAWISSSAGPRPEGGGRVIVVDVPSPIVGTDRFGMQVTLEPIPPPRRGIRPAQCDPQQATRAFDSVLGVLAEHDRIADLQPTEPRRRPQPTEDVARDREIFAVADRSLFRIEIGEDRRATAHEVAPIRAMVPTMGSARQVTPITMHTTTLRSIAFDPQGYLWATGDERLYVCSVDTAACMPEGIVPIDTRAVAFWSLAAGQPPELVAIRGGGVVERLERVAAPRFMGEAGDAVVAGVELCTAPGPAYDPSVVVGPVEGRDGTAYAVVQRPESFVLAVMRDGQPREPGLDVPLPLDPVALVPLDAGILLLSSTGHLVLADRGLERLQVVATTGRPWRAAAAYSAPKAEG